MDYSKLKFWFLASVILFVLAFIIKANGKDIEAKSPWISHPILLDGQMTDWPDGSANFIAEKDALIRVANDSTKVFVMLAFKKAQWAMIIRSSGLTVWLDGQGKKKKIFMLKLVDGPPLDEMRAAMGDQKDSPEQPSPEMMGRMQERDGRMEKSFNCAQKGYLEEKPIPLDGSQGPAAGFGFSNGFFAYEFSIPLSKSDVRYYGLGIQPGQAISVGFIWGEMDKNKMPHDGPPGGGMDGQGPPGGMGGGGMGGGRGGMGGGRHGGGFSGSHMLEKQEIWVKAKLSAPALAGK
jgi:hypothetical protein